MHPARAIVGALFAGFIAIPAVRAIVLIGGDQPVYRIVPPNGAPWKYVARVGSDNGSGVYLGKRFVLTAGHVAYPDQVEFNGAQYALDTAWGERPINDEDLKLIRIANDPGFPNLKLIGLGNNDLGKKCTVIGWGLGNGMPVTNQGWQWGLPRTQRWGTNVTLTTLVLSEGHQRLATTFDLEAGATETCLANSDSGGALFQRFEGVWKLAGLAVDTESNASFYDHSPDEPGRQPDRSYFVRIKDHRATIKQIMATAAP